MAGGAHQRERGDVIDIKGLLRTIRDETTAKVRRAEFAERMTPEERRRAETALARFRAVFGVVLGEDEDEDE